MESNIVHLILNIAAKFNHPTAILGGLALPAYNVARSTLDIDICIHVKTQLDLDSFIKELKVHEILTVQNPKIDDDLFTVFGVFGEAEIWLKPCDAFNWDDKMIKKRKNFFENVYVLSIEDFILTKLARADRSSIDVDDILQVIITNKNRIDWSYLFFRLKWIKIEKEFKNIISGFEMDYNKNIRKISKEIIDKMNGL